MLPLVSISRASVIGHVHFLAEVGDFLLDAVLIDLEIVLGQVGDDVVVAVAHSGEHVHDSGLTAVNGCEDSGSRCV